MVKLLCVNGLQHRHDDSQQLLRVLECLHIEVHTAATLGIKCIQLTPTDLAWWKGCNGLRACWSLSYDSLSLGWVKAVGRLYRRRAFSARLIQELDSRAMHVLQILLYAPIDLVFGVPGTHVSSNYPRQ
jgi:hypothetical protein